MFDQLLLLALLVALVALAFLGWKRHTSRQARRVALQWEISAIVARENRRAL